MSALSARTKHVIRSCRPNRPELASSPSQRPNDSGKKTSTTGGGGAHTIESVTERLEEAGATLLSLPASRTRTDLRTSRWPIIHAAIDAYGWSGTRLRPAIPMASAISRMDQALAWIGLIPQDSYVLRRIVGARALVSPLTGRYLFTWRRLGTLLGADSRAIKRWHAKGIAAIVESLNRTAPRPETSPSRSPVRRIAAAPDRRIASDGLT